jgi:hypothetical protein
MKNGEQFRGMLTIKFQMSGESVLIKTAQILKPLTDSRGYLCMELIKQGNHGVRKIHALVANEFLERPLSKPFIHHIDRNHRNNPINSLRFRAYPVKRAGRLRADSDEYDCEEYESEEGERDEDGCEEGECDEDGCEEEEGV